MIHSVRLAGLRRNSNFKLKNCETTQSRQRCSFLGFSTKPSIHIPDSQYPTVILPNCSCTAPHLQSLLSKMRQQGAKSPKPPSQSGGRDETMSTASGAGQSDTEGAAPVGSDAHAASQPQVENISIVDRFSTTVTGSGRTAEEFTSRLFREIAAQHQLQVCCALACICL